MMENQIVAILYNINMDLFHFCLFIFVCNFAQARIWLHLIVEAFMKTIWTCFFVGIQI